mmetsp:Transcript_6265/g.27590  ORF Transcript_6265/g.27590 Transcript_6265/m.27590 type:complete len:224 (-) Transcript_6265:303-974(-)
MHKLHEALAVLSAILESLARELNDRCGNALIGGDFLRTALIWIVTKVVQGPAVTLVSLRGLEAAAGTKLCAHLLDFAQRGGRAFGRRLLLSLGVRCQNSLITAAFLLLLVHGVESLTVMLRKLLLGEVRKACHAHLHPSLALGPFALASGVVRLDGGEVGVEDLLAPQRLITRRFGSRTVRLRLLELSHEVLKGGRVRARGAGQIPNCGQRSIGNDARGPDLD